MGVGVITRCTRGGRVAGVIRHSPGYRATLGPQHPAPITPSPITYRSREARGRTRRVFPERRLCGVGQGHGRAGVRAADRWRRTVDDAVDEDLQLIDVGLIEPLQEPVDMVAVDPVGV